MSSALIAQVGEVADINPTFKSTTISPDELVDFLPMAAVEEGNSVAQATEFRALAEVQKGYTSFSDGDVLLAKITPCFENGKIAQVRLKHRCGFGSTEFHVLRPHVGKLDGRYLVHFLRRDEIRIDGARKMTGSAGQRRVPKHYLESLPIYLPPLSEQRRIAAILDQADALRAKRREALAQLDSLTQSIFIEMFGSAQTIYERWPVKPLGEILEFLTSGSRGWAEYYAETGAIFLRIQNVCRDFLDLNDVAYVSAPDSAEARRTEVRGGDVLLSITADLGRTAVVPFNIGKAHINQHLSILRTTAVMPRYLSAFIASPAGQREVMGRNKQGVKAGLNFDDIRSFRIPMPPRHLQQEFVARAEYVGKQIQVHYQSANELDSLFASLQHRAFRGEL